MSIPAVIPVALRRTAGYDPEPLAARVAELLHGAGASFRPGERILVKPNLVAPANAALSTTHPAVVAAVCRHLLDQGVKVVVGDSPAFGSAMAVGRKTGLDVVLARLGVPLITLDRPVRIQTNVGSIGVARQALEVDRILNLPRLKAHCQLRLSAAVKNLFGCVVGFRKALAHACHGDKADRFERLLVDVMLALPPVVSLLDGITAMHVKGPTGGRPIDLGLLAACADPAALDTAAYGLLGPLRENSGEAAMNASSGKPGASGQAAGLSPDDVPLWREAVRRGLPGADPANLTYPLERPEAFDCSGFILPARLDPVTFHPARLVRGRLKSLWLRLR